MNPENLKPASVWKHFFHICSIPHPSHHEEALARDLYAWAKSKGFEAELDQAHNLVIRRKAAPGHEKAPAVILQSHLDMVAQAEESSGHNFLTDPIVPRLDPSDPQWLMASGTTLGADDGIGAAISLAILEDQELAAGPIECLFTVNEEDGMTGAKALETGFVRGSLLINLDGERDRELTVGCAGSVRSYGAYQRPAIALDQGSVTYRVELSGLLGGHSGVDISKGRGNAALCLARALSACGPFRLVSFHGGDAGNAIPRSCKAVIALQPSALGAFRDALRREELALKAEFKDTDPGMVISLRDEPGAGPEGLGEAESAAFLSLLAGTPNGLVEMDPDVAGAIKTSLNLGIANAEARSGSFELSTTILVRSSSNADRDSVAARAENHLAGLSALGWGVSSRRPSAMGAWTPMMSSPLLEKTKAAYKAQFGREPELCTTHGGLECAYFKPRFPHWDMVSFGPDMQYPHSPGERVRVASVADVYGMVKRLLSSLA